MHVMDGRQITWSRALFRNFYCFFTDLSMFTGLSRALFYRAANGIFGNFRRVVPRMFYTHCWSWNVYSFARSRGLPLSRRDLKSLDFIVNRFFMKLFRTSDISVQEMLHFIDCAIEIVLITLHYVITFILSYRDVWKNLKLNIAILRLF